MHPLLRALLSSWEWRFEIIAILLLFGGLYSLGWWRLRRRTHRRSKLAVKWRLASYWGGLLLLAVALMSPIDPLGGQLFFMHMIQHLLTIMFAAPLLWLANPFPFILWGLPIVIRAKVAPLFTSQSQFRSLLAICTRPSISWLFFITIYLGWHDPNAYNLALRRSWVHDIEHITFFLAGMIYWWHVIGAGPRIHGRFPVLARIGYCIGAIPPNMLAGVTIAYSGSVIYTYYESVPRIWGLTALQDQMIGGVIMWIPGSMMFIAAALILLVSILREETPQHAPQWDSEKSMIAPGLEERTMEHKLQELTSAKASTTADVS